MKKFMALMLCVLLLLSGCRTAKSLSPQGNVPETRTDEEIDAAGEEAREDIRALFPDAEFNVSDAGAVSLDYTGEAAQLSVTDDAGLTWTLSIPEGALAQPTTITMTPLADVSGGAGARSGVLFGPSGLLFAVPATLSVTGPGADKMLLLSADENGRDLTPTATAPGEDGTEALVFHFSTIFADAPPEIQAEFEVFMKDVDKLYDKYYDKARKLLDKQIKPPKPMGAKLECFDENALDQIIEEVENTNKEEREYASALLIVLQADHMNGNAARARTLEPMVQALAERAQQKLEMLVSLDNPKPETFFYAFQAMLQYMRLIAFDAAVPAMKGLTGTLDAQAKEKLKDLPGKLDTVFQKLQAAGEYSWQYLLDSIAKEHRYSLIMASLLAELLLTETAKVTNDVMRKSGDGADAENRRQQLSDACTFTVYFEGTTTQKRDSTAKWTTSGEGKVSLDQFLGDETIERDLIFRGEAQGTYDHYSSTDPAAVKTLLTKDFETEIHLVLELPCCLTGRAGVSQFGAGDLTYQSDEGPITVPSGIKFLNQLALSEYYDAQLQAVMADMSLTLGKALAQKKINGKHEYTTIEYTIFLEHTPQLGG
ncbi:MAG: hypothetical protein ACOX88_07455 [Christensenellales bacterium]|jgi:hypothetical protein